MLVLAMTASGQVDFHGGKVVALRQAFLNAATHGNITFVLRNCFSMPLNSLIMLASDLAWSGIQNEGLSRCLLSLHLEVLAKNAGESNRPAQKIHPFILLIYSSLDKVSIGHPWLLWCHGTSAMRPKTASCVSISRL